MEDTYPEIACLPNCSDSHANELLKDLSSCLVRENVNANLLTNRDSPVAASLRGLLLGRKPNEGATWDELWIARLQHIVPFEEVVFDDCTGLVRELKYRPSEEVCFSKREAMIRLSGVTEVVIKHWPTTMQDKMRRKNGTLNNLLLEHLFNLSRRGDTFCNSFFLR